MRKIRSSPVHLWLASVVATSALLLFGCATVPPGGKAVMVSVSGTPTLNQCNRPKPYSLTCRVVLVSDTSPIRSAVLKQVWGKEADVFGAALLGTPRELVVGPGQKDVTLPIEGRPGATSVIVIGNFYCPTNSGWYVEQPLSRGRRLKLLAGSDSLVFAR